MIPLALGELFGPVKCEHAGCSGNAWMIWMTKDEHDAAKTQTYEHPVLCVFRRQIGTALCSEHAPKKQ